jgi:hypothetical protein
MKIYTKGNLLQNAITIIILVLTRFYGQNSDNEMLITSMTRHAEFKFSIEWINEEISSLIGNIFSSSILWIFYLVTSIWEDDFVYVFSFPISDLSWNYPKNILTALSVT